MPAARKDALPPIPRSHRQYGMSLCFQLLSVQLERPGNVRPMLKNAVDEAIRHGRLAAHEIVSIRVLLDALHALPRVLSKDAIQAFASVEHLARVNVDIRGLALKAPQGL